MGNIAGAVVAVVVDDDATAAASVDVVANA
jgi:hypothetical protein